MVFLRTVGRTSVLVALATSLFDASILGAQRRVIAGPRGQQRIAHIAPPPAAPQQIPNYQYGETVFGTVPAIITADGRVLVNLGYGYEQVARTCPYAYGYACQSYGYPMAPQTPIFGPYGPTNYQPPTYMPPAYGAPQYPAPTYPGAYQPYQSPPRYNPPSSPQANGCPPGYVPTGSYPPCIDPVRSPASTLTIGGPQAGPVAVRVPAYHTGAAASGSAATIRRR